MDKFLQNSRVSYYSLLTSLALASIIPSFCLNADTSYKVRNTDNLNKIVNLFYKERTLTKTQIMLGIFNRNPDAFKSGNMHSLRSGVRLILPDENNLTVYSPEDAKEVLKEHSQQQDAEDFSLSDLVKRIQESEAKQSAEEINLKQQKQSKKIKQLEQDGDELREQLEKLLSEKKQRDHKLAKLELAIKKSLASKANINAVQELKPKPIPTKILNESDDIVGATKDKAVFKDTEADKELNQVVDNQEVGSQEIGEPLTNESKTEISRLIWLIPLLLGLGFLLSKLWKKERKEDTSYNDMLGNEEYILDSEVLDLDYEKHSLETSIKLDVAKAYIDMNDTEAATDILKDIVKEGDAILSEEAQKLLQTI